MPVYERFFHGFSRMMILPRAERGVLRSERGRVSHVGILGAAPGSLARRGLLRVILHYYHAIIELCEVVDVLDIALVHVGTYGGRADPEKRCLAGTRIIRCLFMVWVRGFTPSRPI